jgi:hypothetical protein
MTVQNEQLKGHPRPQSNVLKLGETKRRTYRRLILGSGAE